MANALPLLAATSVAAAADVRVASWNVYYKALDDAYGRAAVTQAFDAADAAAPFDFVAAVEAGGDTAGGAFPAWTKGSTCLSGMGQLSGKSGYETIALLYRKDKWTAGYHTTGEFESGRPFLIAQFTPKAPVTVGANASTALWVMAVHLNHYFLNCPGKCTVDTVVPGQVMADALRNASSATGTDISSGSVVLMGDFNEFEWANFQKAYIADAKKRMAPLWDGYFHGRMQDMVPAKTVSCCTKWAAADRSKLSKNWIFMYDHIFVSPDLAQSAPQAEVADDAVFLPYTYPGTASACADAACTGENPPGGVTATHQGSWHRGVHATLRFG